jgi:HPt (histidine-containing phosphotransfer) domain-containing protein
MVQLTLLDHLRMTFGNVVSRHYAHANLARSRARSSRWLRGAQALLMVGVAYTAMSVAFGGGAGLAVACAILAALALVVLLVQLSFDFDASAQAHATCASRLWLIREEYRALLSDLADGALELDGARRGRDALMRDLHDIYGNAPALEHHAYQTAERAAAEEKALTDEQINVFLPKSLQKAGG